MADPGETIFSSYGGYRGTQLTRAGAPETGVCARLNARRGELRRQVKRLRAHPRPITDTTWEAGSGK
jgi:hypothetical protein